MARYTVFYNNEVEEYEEFPAFIPKNSYIRCVFGVTNSIAWKRAVTVNYNTMLEGTDSIPDIIKAQCLLLNLTL